MKDRNYQQRLTPRFWETMNIEQGEYTITDLLLVFEGQAVASSRKVAERFDRSHKEILEAIQKIVCDGPSLERHFVENAYMNSLNRSKTEFLMDRKGFFLVVGNFVGKAALIEYN